MLHPSKHLEISIHLCFCLDSLSNFSFFMIPLETNFFSLVVNDTYRQEGPMEVEQMADKAWEEQFVSGRKKDSAVSIQASVISIKQAKFE